jgi:hypothetical protein
LVTVEDVRKFFGLAATWAFLCGCEPPPSTPLFPDGGPPLILEIQNPSSQIGLHYGNSVQLASSAR